MLSPLSQIPPELHNDAIAVIQSDPVLRQWAALNDPECGWANFVPRPDKPEQFDQQESFCNSRDMVSMLVGGNAAGTTEAASFKTAQFLLYRQPPPRKNTPFWIISNTYDQVCGVAWDEKLYGHGHIPMCEVDYENISWLKHARNWPLAVPLKPWPVERGGDPNKNWQIEFKSYEQGRRALQARSIGGFWFSEQFPLDLFLETLRGCREYMYPGGQFCEFTPIEPELCLWIEKAMDDRPEGWEFYRCNTEMNKPNLAEGWYDNFFAGVPDEMLQTRMTGALATFEGVIFQAFNPAVHVVDGPTIFPPGVQHYRGVDWGASEEHPFCCIWGYRDGVGDWYIYDEYWNNSQAAITLDHVEAIVEKSLEWQWPGEWATDKALTASGPVFQPTPSQWHLGTFADPSRPGELNEFNFRGITTHMAANDVLKGIDCIRSLLKIQAANNRPRIFIHKRCIHLIEEMRKYRWMRGRKPTQGVTMNPQVAKISPLKRDDDTCFIAGTIVHSKGELVPIEQVKQGDVLLSHRGETIALTDAVLTRNAEVYRITLTDGRVLTGTAQHPLAVDGNEWVSLCQSKDRNVNVLNSPQSVLKPVPVGNLSKSLNTMAFGGEGIPLHHSGVPTGISQVELTEKLSCCIGKFIGIAWGQFLKEATYTTLTAMKRTISQPIWKFLRRGITRSGIFRVARRNAGQPTYLYGRCARNVYGSFQLNTSYANASVSVQKNVPTISKGCDHVSCVERLTSREERKRERRVLRNANQNYEAKVAERCTHENTRKEHTSEATIVLCAESQSPAQVRKLARKNVRMLSVAKVEKLPGKHDVYNLATSSGTFFANGVLVSNCDALRYMIFSVERGYGAVPGSMTHNGHEKRRGVQLRQGGDGVARGSNGNGNGHGNGSGRLGAGFFNKG